MFNAWDQPLGGKFRFLYKTERQLVFFVRFLFFGGFKRFFDFFVGRFVLISVIVVNRETRVYLAYIVGLLFRFFLFGKNAVNLFAFFGR